MRGNSNYGAGGVTLTTSVGFTNYGTAYVDGQYNGDGGSQFTIGGTLTNNGTFDIGNLYLSAATKVTATSLSNNGSLVVAGAISNAAQATLDITGAALAAATGYTRVSGDALLEFASGGVTYVSGGSWFELDGATAVASIGAGTTDTALKDLATNYGTLDLRGDSNLGAGGAALTTSVGFTNYGTAYVDGQYNGDGGSQLTIGGGLTNSGTLDIGNSYLSAATKVTATSLSNNGSLVVAGAASNAAQATLDITGAAPAAATGYTRSLAATLCLSSPAAASPMFLAARGSSSTARPRWPRSAPGPPIPRSRTLQPTTERWICGATSISAPAGSR